MESETEVIKLFSQTFQWPASELALGKDTLPLTLVK